MQRFDVAQVVNNTSRVDVKQVSRADHRRGHVLLLDAADRRDAASASAKAATRARLPAARAAAGTAGRAAAFFTPYDLMVYGFGPVVPICAHRRVVVALLARQRRLEDLRRQRRHATMLRTHQACARRPAASDAVEVRSTLHQAGFRFGSGTRTSWFAPGKGLVKLVFRTGDGSVSTVQRVH